MIAGLVWTAVLCEGGFLRLPASIGRDCLAVGVKRPLFEERLCPDGRGGKTAGGGVRSGGTIGFSS